MKKDSDLPGYSCAVRDIIWNLRVKADDYETQNRRDEAIALRGMANDLVYLRFKHDVPRLEYAACDLAEAVWGDRARGDANFTKDALLASLPIGSDQEAVEAVLAMSKPERERLPFPGSWSWNGREYHFKPPESHD